MYFDTVTIDTGPEYGFTNMILGSENFIQPKPNSQVQVGRETVPSLLCCVALSTSLALQRYEVVNHLRTGIKFIFQSA
jgi:hypothetical protein